MINSVCSAETPLIEWLPTIARWVMRTCLGVDSSISDIRRSRSVSFWVGGRDSVEKAAVDLMDDLQVSRQHRLQQRHRPLLQRLRRQRVIRETDARLRDFPCFLPGDVFFIDEEPHQLGDRQRGMRVVQLNRDLVGEISKRRRDCCSYLRTMSRTAQATRKYSCISRNSRPATTASEG